MNTSLTRAPQHTASALSFPVVETRLGLLDRLSLRLGLRGQYTNRANREA